MLLAGYALGRWPGVHISQHISVVRKKFWSLVIPVNIRSTGREFYIWTSNLRTSLRCQFSLSYKVNHIIGKIGKWCCLTFLYSLSFECLIKAGGVVKLIDFGLAKKLPDGEETLRSAFASLHLFLSDSIDILDKHSFSKVSQHSAGYFEIRLPWKF